MRRFALQALILFAAQGVSAEGLVYGVLPETDQLFKRLMADPRQAQTLVRYYRNDSENLADVALGNAWGLARWRVETSDEPWLFQVNIEGMGYSRFLLTGGINEFQTIDFFANLPFEARHGKFSSRATLFHQSSHLGDDFIRRTGSTGFRYSVEGMTVILSYELFDWLRVYGGGLGMIHAVPVGQNGGLQWGFELKSTDLGWFNDQTARVYLAQDFGSRTRVSWNVNSSTELGIRMSRSGVIRALRVHLGYYTGRSSFAQFFRNHESYFSFGLSFEFAG